ncbi:hypothetical protein PoB_002872500 [Plakobranchus ocellatus]|uniref:Uncharacterized protein n=1 Tax=Plakobranchus ocellatus TaxID=259542 RepID=A0AAV4A5W3_9GAST|nr:hypothetical protein PoB_002872500 [Plakobranchus ocellatus]
MSSGVVPTQTQSTLRQFQYVTASLSYSCRRALSIRKPSPPCDSSSTLQPPCLIHVVGRCPFANPVHPATVPVRYSLSVLFMSSGVVHSQTQSTLSHFQYFTASLSYSCHCPCPPLGSSS